MEAKGCAKALVWKDSRRHFYWALRARLAKARVLKEFTAAAPGAARDRLAETLNSIDSASDNKSLAEVLEKLDIGPALKQLQSDDIVGRLVALAQQDPDALNESLTRIAADMSGDVRSQLLKALKGRSGGTYISIFAFFRLTVSVGSQPPSYSH